MKSTWRIWLVWGASLAVLFSAMGWVSSKAVRFEEGEAEALRQSEREGNVRLALWRMESMVAPLLAQEGARPYFTYSAFYPAQRAYSCMFDEWSADDIPVPSPLLNRKPDDVVLHFQIHPDSRVTSPQVPTSPAEQLSMGCVQVEECVPAFQARMEELRGLLSRKDLLKILPEPPLDQTVTSIVGRRPRFEPVPRNRGRQSQAALNRNDLQQRSYAIEQMQQAQWLENNIPTPPTADVVEGIVKPFWFREHLFLARRVLVAGREYVQGAWLDWAALRNRLLNNIQDILPNADLVAVAGAADTDGSRLLQTLPLRLAPGNDTRPDLDFLEVRLSVGVAWACVILAGLCMGALLWGTVSLSNRRGAFVSAVTHELRTPLTTFRMYTEMLSEGMVKDEAKQKRYLDKLRTEAERLGHLVENVLGFARLEGRKASPREAVPIRTLIERVSPRLSERAEQAGMTLSINQESLEALPPRVNLDVSAADQILFNLVDNAAKYASSATDRRIHLDGKVVDGKAVLQVRDHGPGIGKAEARRLFVPFSKSDTEAANSAPGVGLGLAFSRELARRMGGDLLYVPQDDGARFDLHMQAA